MSVIPLKADIHKRGLHVRKVPKADLMVRLFGLVTVTSLDPMVVR